MMENNEEENNSIDEIISKKLNDQKKDGHNNYSSTTNIKNIKTNNKIKNQKNKNISNSVTKTNQKNKKNSLPPLFSNNKQTSKLNENKNIKTFNIQKEGISNIFSINSAKPKSTNLLNNKNKKPPSSQNGKIIINSINKKPSNLFNKNNSKTTRNPTNSNHIPLKKNKTNQKKIPLTSLPTPENSPNFSIFHFLKTNNIYIFLKNSKFSENFQKTPEIFKNNIYEIIENFTLPPAYRPRMNNFGNIPKCIIETCKIGNISMLKNFDNCNLIWKLLHPDKMRALIRNLHKNQKFNHFPCTYQLGRKDNLYKHYKTLKRIIPDIYNYMPMTFLLPFDIDYFETEYKKNKKIIWIVKPVNMSRGRGIHLLRGENEYKKLYKKAKELNASQYLISKYLDKPHLINEKKYDLRIYVLVTSFTPLRIYLYYNGLVRFATENYIKGDYQNVYIHLTNYSINKNNPKYKSNQKNNKEIDEEEININNNINNEDEEEEIEEDDSSKWSLVEYKNFFIKNKIENKLEYIWKQIEEIVIKSIISVTDYNCKEISGNKNNNLFELYGFDIFIDDSFRAWLIECNVNPSLHCTSPLDLSIKTDLICDIFNIVGIIPYNHNSNDEIYNFNKKNLPKIQKNEQKNENNMEKNLINVKSIIEKNFDYGNLRKKINEYDNEYYKKMIEIYNEEKERAKTTGFSFIYPKKENIEFYSDILSKVNFVNDTNCVLWEYILNNE